MFEQELIALESRSWGRIPQKDPIAPTQFKTWMISRDRERVKNVQESRLNAQEMLPDDVNYGMRHSSRDPSMTFVELVILWKYGYIRPSTSVVLQSALPLVGMVVASVFGILHHVYFFLIPLVISIAILILIITPMFLASLRMALSIGTIASMKSRDRGVQINMTLVALAIVTILLVFILVDSGVIEDGARLQITVESIDGINSRDFNIYVDGSIVESGTLEPSESLTINHVHRWPFPEATNVTILVEWTLLHFGVMYFWSEKIITVMHGEFYSVDLYI